MTLSTQKIHEIISSVVFQQMRCKDEKIVVIYDENCELARIIYNTHLAVTPNATFLKYDENNPKEIREMLLSLEPGSSVFLIESLSFRLDDFRIRLLLFNNGVGCLEYSHLELCKGEEMETFLRSIEYQGEEFARLGGSLKNILDTCDALQIFSGKNSQEVLTFGPLEESKLNDGRFYQQKNRGGSVVCGEVFTEAKDLRGVQGKLSINCYPDQNYLIKECENFSVTIENGCITHVDENAPQEFLENVIERVQKGGEVNEDGEPEVMIREAGFGLNPHISLEKKLPFVSVFERHVGFHVSVGKKHMVYRKKFHKKDIQRFHIDIFSDTKKIIAKKNGEDRVVFEDGKYTL